MALSAVCNIEGSCSFRVYRILDAIKSKCRLEISYILVILLDKIL